jgi:hypothetical protein
MTHYRNKKVFFLLCDKRFVLFIGQSLYMTDVMLISDKHMIETWKLTQDNDQVYDKCNVVLR